MRSRRIWIPFVLALACALLGAPSSAQPPTPVVMRVGTLVPRTPPLERAVREWNRQLGERSGGTLQVRVWWGGTMGDEVSMVRRMRVGELDGANLTSLGLCTVVPQVAVMQ